MSRLLTSSSLKKEIMKLGILVLLSIFVLFQSCKTDKYFFIQSTNSEQCLTVMDKGDSVRYIIQGKFLNQDQIPESNYVKLDISNYFDFEDIDGLTVCWKNESNKCEISMELIKIIENKLDTSKYIFYDEIPVDRNINSFNDAYIKYIEKDGCFDVDLIKETISPKGRAILKKN